MYFRDQVGYRPLPLPDRMSRPDTEALAASQAFRDYMRKRHTMRDFRPDPVPEAIIAAAVEAAGTAPAAANHQPWHFAAISDPAKKARIRAAAETEEAIFYAGGAGDEWLKALASTLAARAMNG